MSSGILGLIPARGQSRRLPGKNMSLLGGKTLVRRALETAAASGCFEPVALSSESPEVLAEADGLAGVVPLARPPELATDEARSYDVVIDALRLLEEHGAERFDAVAIIQCTSPFTAPEDLRGAVDLFETSGAASVASVVRLEAALHPLKLKRLEGTRLVPYIEDDAMLPSHELPPVWVRNGSIYLTRRSVIDSGRLMADEVHGYEMPPERSHDIDTPIDLAFARFCYSAHGIPWTPHETR